MVNPTMGIVGVTPAVFVGDVHEQGASWGRTGYARPSPAQQDSQNGQGLGGTDDCCCLPRTTNAVGESQPVTIIESEESLIAEQGCLS
jgi:hypothetical protein